jgi:hypothetical protein
MLSVAAMKEKYPDIFTSEGRLNLQVKTFGSKESFEAAMADAEKTSDVNYAIDSTFIRDENGNLKFDAEVKGNNITECGKQFYDMYNLVEECLERGVKVILPTPVDYDEEWDGYTGERILGLKYICADTSEFIKTILAEKEGVDFVDFYAVQLELKKQLQAEDSTKSYTYDRKHFTGMVAPYAIASTFMVDMYGKNLIHGENATKVTDYAAKTEILADGSIVTSNASVSELSVGESAVSFLYKPHGISIGYVSDFQKAKAILGDDEVYIEDIAKYAQNMNQEIIKVSGLADGSYKIKMGTYTLTGTYTAEELAEGVDISCDANNPSRLVSDLIIKEINAKKSLFSKLTNMAYVRQNYLLPYGVNDRTDSREVVESRINEAHASAVASGSSFGASSTAKFMENYDALDDIHSEIDLHSYNVKKLMDFDAYQVVIEKAN